MKNALFWGMCCSHFHQVRLQSQLDSRIAHLALAILEAIPVIGQIISLIELKIIRAYARPLPTSCIPRVAKTAIQERPTDITRTWPQDLKWLGLTTAQKIEVDNHVREAFRALAKGETVSYSKKRLSYPDGTRTIEATLPISLTIYKESPQNPTWCVLLFPKTVFAKGGERKIRWAYELTTGTFLLKKRVVGTFEETLLNYLSPLRMARGISAPTLWRTTSGKTGRSKQQIIEPVRTGTLSRLFGTAPLSNFSVKRDLIIDLLADLKALHEGRLPEVKITIPPTIGSPPKTIKRTYCAFHSDIKPSNILVSFQNGKWRAELSDFGGSAAHPLGLTISVGFTPPEYIRFYQKERPFGIHKAGSDDIYSLVEFNIKHGQGRDIWSLGLVILSLLAEREEVAVWKNVFEKCHKSMTIPPLPCLKAMLSGHLWRYYDEEGILDLKQETLNAELDQLEKEIAPRHPEERAGLSQIFEMLKKMMLRVDSTERKTVAHCLAAVLQ